MRADGWNRMQSLRRLTAAILGALLAILLDARAGIVTIVTWNLEWFPGGKPNSSPAERLVHMSAAKDALIDIRPDILCLQEVRDWDSVAELVSILPRFQTLVVSRFREMGSSGPLSIQQLAIASSRPAEAAWSESFRSSPPTPPRGFSFAAIRVGKTLLLVYSVHFKSNRGEAATNIAKREEAARQLLSHVAAMETAYSESASVVTVIGGRFQHRPDGRPFCLGTNLPAPKGDICLVLGKGPAVRAGDQPGERPLPWRRRPQPRVSETSAGCGPCEGGWVPAAWLQKFTPSPL